MNMIVSVFERIGILKSYGMLFKNILRMFLPDGVKVNILSNNMFFCIKKKKNNPLIETQLEFFIKPELLLK